MSIEIKITKPEVDIPKYLQLIQTLTEASELSKAEDVGNKLQEALKNIPQYLHLIPSPQTDLLLSSYITQDKDSIDLKSMVKKLSMEKDAVLIIGESGTGKEILARALHGSRKGQFIPFNCAAMPQELIESELFGHVQGAFTGASGMKLGLFETAKYGTLFLDEIGDLPLQAQAKLLRVLQDKKIRKVGGVEETSIDVRIIAATHHNLAELVEQKLFRLDLYSRINTFPIITKAIRYRRGDIPMIVNALSTRAGKINELLNKEPFREFSYPSNVRDIQRFCRQYEVLGRIL
jgi:transcriptional regulator with PAS, ATPase and Fis domain